MFKTFLVLVALVFCTEIFSNPVYAQNYPYIDPEVVPYLDGSRKVMIATDPSFCSGYAKVKTEQHEGEQYYKDMLEFYDRQISDTDMMTAPVDKESYLMGYDMMDDKKIMNCAEVFDNERGFSNE